MYALELLYVVMLGCHGRCLVRVQQFVVPSEPCGLGRLLYPINIVYLPIMVATLLAARYRCTLLC